MKYVINQKVAPVPSGAGFFICGVLHSVNAPQVQFKAKPIHDRKVNSCRRQFILALLEREGGR